MDFLAQISLWAVFLYIKLLLYFATGATKYLISFELCSV